ncbi:alpha-L-rhamnosidase [Kockovaella imperatae]|uniref:alpha-L-rhamnosidase n=1 Tax=Kockovaella imperatae TaxID=4999 RepID=A0A1Y1UNM6_9TREE|nr:alpha-L-rhamnosidase [Kockovaella imperatae]ORX38725.1 alpha-L-rhamnosidase [Kockovaella imperatae]
MSAPRISRLTVGRNTPPYIGIGQSRPRLGWRFESGDTDTKNWIQSEYELVIQRTSGENNTYRVKSEASVDIAWPDKEASLESREQVSIRVRARGNDGWTEWHEESVETALLAKEDWAAKVITTDVAQLSRMAKRPFYTRTTFNLDQKALDEIRCRGGARLYATALGVYKLELNGERLGDHVLAPGWQSYHHRLHYQTYKVPADRLCVGENVLGAIVGEGWYAGRLTWAPEQRNVWGSEIGVRIQLEMPHDTVLSDESWQWSYGPIISSELYDGEVFDAGLIDAHWSTSVSGSQPSSSSWRPVKTIPMASSISLIAPEAPPIRITDMLSPKEIITSPKGKTIIDFGQNISGWVRIPDLPADPHDEADHFKGSINMRFAEVLDQGEIGMRPLRTAKATDQVFFSDKPGGMWEPSFTTHGFRYVEVTGTPVDHKTFQAVVVHSDLERLGDFGCDHALVNKLHQNVVWGLRGNFVGLPTDCPQRDERLGWTGDINMFAPTASYLYDCHGFLSNWLHDLSAEQLLDNMGVPPVVSPDPASGSTFKRPFPQSVWSDVIAMGPDSLYQAYGGTMILEELFSSMCVWLDKGIPRGANGLWHNPPDGFQFADWLDPRAPPDDAAAAMTDQFLVADAYLVGVTRLVSRIASLVGKTDKAGRYAEDHDRLRKEFRNEYVTVNGRLASDSQTAIVLALQFDLLDQHQIPHAVDRLVRLVTKNDFRIGTGFAGTPVILDMLHRHGALDIAYKMLLTTKCPSWLYPVTMGATTVWERWDSLLPDGSINPGEMTSFNHYALGAVARFFHNVIAGLSPLDPGWKKMKISPQPGSKGEFASAWTWHMTPYGKATVKWEMNGGKLDLEVEIPPNTTAEVHLGEQVVKKVGSGHYHFTV